MTPATVLRFWFDELTPQAWFTRDDALDAQIRQRFMAVYETLSAGVPEEWLGTVRGLLAAVIVLDQFPRNMFRNDPRAFATDAAALDLVQQALDRGLNQNLSLDQRKFLYMPFQHAEDRAAQARSVELFASTDVDTLEFARQHKLVIDRFGRFPHRNMVLGRESTDEERAFLQQPGSSF